jgi:hypothetical protein
VLHRECEDVNQLLPAWPKMCAPLMRSVCLSISTFRPGRGFGIGPSRQPTSRMSLTSTRASHPSASRRWHQNCRGRNRNPRPMTGGFDTDPLLGRPAARSASGRLYLARPCCPNASKRLWFAARRRPEFANKQQNARLPASLDRLTSGITELPKLAMPARTEGRQRQTGLAKG